MAQEQQETFDPSKILLAGTTAESATWDEIKANYKKWSRDNHPDKHKNSAEAKVKFDKVKVLYDAFYTLFKEDMKRLKNMKEVISSKPRRVSAEDRGKSPENEETGEKKYSRLKREIVGNAPISRNVLQALSKNSNVLRTNREDSGNIFNSTPSFISILLTDKKGITTEKETEKNEDMMKSIEEAKINDAEKKAEEEKTKKNRRAE